jgi:hypothetical protein
MTLIAHFAFSSICISRIFLHLGSVSESATTTLTATSASFSKLTQRAQRRAPPKTFDSDTISHGPTVNYVTHYAEGRGKISWIEMGGLDAPQQHDSVVEGT